MSAAAAYNHFPTKHNLVGHVYRPLVLPLRVQAERDLSSGRPVVDALADQVRALVRTTSRHRVLTSAFLGAVQDYATRVNAPPRSDDELDPRTVAPMPTALRMLVERGQATGELRRYPSALDISGMIINLLLIRGLNLPHEQPEATTELLLTMMFGALRPELLVDPGRAGRPFAGGLLQPPGR